MNTRNISKGVQNSKIPTGNIKGSGVLNQSEVVKDSTGWVPNVIPSENSLLDKLFFYSYD